ncbi:MAG TPA: amino acid permease [Candidatus Acidoferrum sp.]|nr:amino acid permease [Candidatus Acidoferrum sp.]
MAVSRKVFVRDATGLVRSLTWFDGMMFTLAYYNIAVAAFIVFGWGSWLFPGANMAISVGVIGLLIDIPIVIGYSFLAMGMPRAGGDYVFVSRALSAPLGTGVAFVFMIFFAIFSYGQNAWFAVTTALSPGLAVLSYNMNSPTLASWATLTGTNANLQVAIGLVLIAITFILTLVPTSALHKVFLVLSPIALIGYPIIYIGMLLTSSNAAFQSAFNTYGALYSTSYQGIINSATQGGAIIAPFSWAASLAALPIVYATLAFPNSAVYTAGETKRPMKAIPVALGLGVVVICVSTYLMGFVTYGVFGFNFIQATAFYGFSGATGYPLPAPPFTNLFFGILFNNAALNAFMLLSAEAWELLLMVSCSFIASRLVFSLAFDRVIPSGFADISERFHTPLKANIIAGIGAIVFLVASAYNFLGTYVNSIVAWTSVYLIVMLTATIFPFIKKATFESFPPPANKKIGGFPIMSIAGIFGTIAILVVFYELFASPVVGVSSGSIVSSFIVVLVYGIGFAIYYAAKIYNKKQGIDLGFVFKEIPPE